MSLSIPSIFRRIRLSSRRTSFARFGIRKWQTIVILYLLCILLITAFLTYGRTGITAAIKKSGCWIVKKTVPDPSPANVPRRKNMERCVPIHGKIMVFVAVEPESYKRLYKVALDSVRCYVKSTEYEFKLVDVFNDERTARACNHTTVYFRKHCSAAAYLNDTDWMMVLDADTGVVNPNHCIEEYIDERVNLIFYERFFNWEIACGNYLVKNTDFSRDFLMRWANYEFLQAPSHPDWWKGFDNGALHAAVLETLYSKESQQYKTCEEIWYNGHDYDTYMPFVICTRIYLGSTHVWTNKMKLLRRAHGMVRDWYHTDESWCEIDFMFHGWKKSLIGDENWSSPFKVVLSFHKDA